MNSPSSHGSFDPTTAGMTPPVRSALGTAYAVPPPPPPRRVGADRSPHSHVHFDAPPKQSDSDSFLSAETIDTPTRSVGPFPVAIAAAERRRRSSATSLQSHGAHATPQAHSTVDRHASFADAASIASSDIGSSLGSETEIEYAGAEARNGVCDAVDRRVPFTVQVVVLMLIPIAFLVGITTSGFAVGMQELVYVTANEGFVTALGGCQLAAMLERGQSSQFLATAGSAGYGAVDAAVRGTTAECSAALDAALGSADARLSSVWAPQMRGLLLNVSVMRHRVQKLDVTPAAERALYTAVVAHLQKGRALFLRNGAIRDARIVSELVQAWGALDALGRARAVGAQILTVVGNATAVELERLAGELREAQHVAQQHQALLGWLAQGDVAAVELDARTAAAMALLARLVADPRGVALTPEQWFAQFSTAVAIPDATSELARESVRAIVNDSLLLVFGVLSAATCAGLIVAAQLRVMRRIQTAMEANKRIQRAVLTFVPKAFLRLSGYTSIMQISAGEHHEVATAMLFSDIRAFTTISEHMSNPQLFDWLQRYFAEMTAVTERHKGFIDKFIGDAIFAVFTSPADAVRCGVSMQTSAGQLNLAIVAAGGEYLLKIGVGVHHAVVCVGFLGDAQRITCTMISSEVNIASRLEGLTKQYDAGILVSADAMEQIPAAALAELAHRDLGACQVKGAAKRLRISEVFQADPLPLKQHKAKTKELFERGVSRRNAGDVETGTRLLAGVVQVADDAGVTDGAATFKVDNASACDIFDEK